MLFNGWDMILRTIIVGVLGYIALIILLRISGKRTLSKMNAFDFVVTVALGSTLASVLLSKQVALAQGITAFAVLIGLQFIVTWASLKSTKISEAVKATPTLVFHDGQFLAASMRRERVLKEEVLAAIRQDGNVALSQVKSVVLETDGSFSVLGRSENDVSNCTLENVKNYN